MTSVDVHPDPVPVAEASTADGTRYWQWGDPDAATTIVAVHGFRGDHHGLLPIVARLGHHRVLTPDLPGFGASPPFDDRRHDIAGYAGWLDRFCAEVRPPGATGRLVLLGHSFGSVISSAAVADGLSVDRLVLINPIAAPALEGPRGFLSRLAVGYYRVGRALPEPIGGPLLSSRLIVRGLSEVMATTDDPDLRSWIHDQHHRYFSGYADRRVVVEAFEASVSHHIGEYTDRLLVPTLLIGGDRDDIVPIAAQQRLARRLADARLVILGPVGHLIHYEQPAAAAGWIDEFLLQKA
ncbi:alpha/beta fold hydrolase [Microlunatus soli]|uniref:Pimeloyl-ACP methyl ester carboxylesterase n=1 Tax=Microlunatus soli TaxID=630515 RepID=A0A1H1YGV6_9ACTN|nr:alpha/beta hydrolase [Microlunatus soli]SDT20509.1 Pimeloyl-ACP methyl ester carboxylesterase [Microlunatus soli]